MKTTLSAVVALAATAELASATFSGASPFSSPYNTDNECNAQQSSGFDWSGLDVGAFTTYGDFAFSGFSCAGSFGAGPKRDVRSGRAFQDKCITGRASHQRAESPSFGCGPAPSVQDFSVTEFQVSTEFDCDLEFHYEMPDQSSCKQRAFCSAGGSVVRNDQCGGAVSVTVVYPTQTTGPGTTQTACSVGVHSMSFDCAAAASTAGTSTPTRGVATTSTAASSTAAIPSYPTDVPETTVAETTGIPSYPADAPETSPVAETTAIPSYPADVPETTVAESTGIPSYPADAPETSPVAETTGIPSYPADAPETSPVAETTGIPSYPADVPGTTVAETTGIPSYPAHVPGTIAGPPSYPANSTRGEPVGPSSRLVWATSARAGTSTGSVPASRVGLSPPASPAPSPTESAQTAAGEASPVSSPPASASAPLPARPPPVDMVTVVISTFTTVCPVTATRVTGGSTSHVPTTIAYTSEGVARYEVSTYASVSGGTTRLEVGTTTSTIVATVTSTVCTECRAARPSPASEEGRRPVASPSGRVATAPCPEVLPSCLNTWMLTAGCASNTDADCYCPSESFVTKVFGCLAAHGADDDEVGSAQTYFQGICAPHIASNPAIVTAAAPVGTPAAGPVPVPVPVTTLRIDTTLTAACVESTGVNAGSVIPSSYVTTTISTALTVPRVVFQTYSGSATVSADLVAGTPASGPAGPTGPRPVEWTTRVPSRAPGSNGTIPTSAPPTGFINAGVRSTAALGISSVAIMLAVLAVSLEL
ncbi:hypothetical protein PZA11_007242 [Diplocarpon coronariae]